MDKRLVSIGIPVFNGEKYIENALESLINQTYLNTEILISDNASTDNTQRICEGYCEMDSRIKYERQEINIGPLENFKRVLILAHGEFFMWLGHDDWLSSNYILDCVSRFTIDPENTLVCGKSVYYLNGKYQHDGRLLNLSASIPSNRVLQYYQYVADNGTFYGLMRREHVMRAEFKKVMGGDWIFVASIAFMGKITTLSDISIGRHLMGTSASFENIVSVLGLPKWQATHPHIAIAMSAFKDVINSTGVYKKLPLLNRYLLAWRIQRIIRERHNLTITSLSKKYIRDIKAHVIKKLLRN